MLKVTLSPMMFLYSVPSMQCVQRVCLTKGLCTRVSCSRKTGHSCWNSTAGIYLNSVNRIYDYIHIMGYHRFGDPETQVLLPLLSPESDLFLICLACCHHTLTPSLVRWQESRVACTVVAAAEGTTTYRSYIFWMKFKAYRNIYRISG